MGANVTLAHLVIVFQWASLIIPLYNGIQWQRRLRKIRSNWKQKLDLNMTFLGRPGELSRNKEKQLNKTHTGKAANKKGSQGALDKDLRTFVVREKNPKDPKKPKIELNPEILSYEAQVTTYAERVPRARAAASPGSSMRKTT